VRAECTAPGFLDTAQARLGRNHPFESYRHVEIFHGVQGDIFGKHPPRDLDQRPAGSSSLQVNRACQSGECAVYRYPSPGTIVVQNTYAGQMADKPR
jgi:hypothetical protein